MAEFKAAQKIVGLNEGGYQNNPLDEGNYYMGNLIGTNWGISAPALGAFLGRVPSKLEMMQLPRSTAEQILQANYWLKNNLEKLQNQSVATLIYDGVVNHGTNGMRFLMDKALRLVRRPISYYEVFTVKGIQHLNKINQKSLFDAIKSVRQEKYRASSKTYFKAGWLARLDKIHYYPNNSISGIWPLTTALVVVGISLILIAL